MKYGADIVTRPELAYRSGPWISDAHVAFVCPRCAARLLIHVPVAILNRGDPHNNHLLQSRGESYTYFAEVRAALAPLDEHVCVPGFGVLLDLQAPRYQQLEAASVLLAELAITAPR